MGKIQYEIGHKFPNSKLTYLRESDHIRSRRYIVCECECGNIIDIRQDAIGNYKNKTTCGCERLLPVTKHGENRSPVHNAWVYMRRRVNYDPNYIKKGIKICKEWDDYNTFKKWALENGFCDETPSLERIDNLLNYCPENCIFIPVNDQPKHQTTSRWWYVYGVEYYSSTVAAKTHNVSPAAINRWCNGYTSKGKYFPPKTNCWSVLKYPK